VYELGPPLHLRWPLGRQAWHLWANLSSTPLTRAAALAGDVVYDSAPGDAAAWPPWCVRVAMESA
jgi:hypothetical protein